MRKRKPLWLSKEEARKVAVALEDGHALTSDDQVLWQRFRQHAGQSNDFEPQKQEWDTYVRCEAWAFVPAEADELAEEPQL